MKKITKTFLIVIMGILTLVPFTKVNAKEAAKVYIFHGSTCPHCQEAMAFFDSIESELGDKFDLVKYEVWSDADNAALMKDVAAVLNKDASGVPFIVIGDTVFEGYASNYDEDIKDAIEELYNSNDRYDVMNELGETTTNSSTVYIVLGIIVVGFVSLLAVSKAKAN